jgi:hypothetical protein
MSQAAKDPALSLSADADQSRVGEKQLSHSRHLMGPQGLEPWTNGL